MAWPPVEKVPALHCSQVTPPWPGMQPPALWPCVMSSGQQQQERRVRDSSSSSSSRQHTPTHKRMATTLKHERPAAACAVQTWERLNDPDPPQTAQGTTHTRRCPAEPCLSGTRRSWGPCRCRCRRLRQHVTRWRAGEEGGRRQYWSEEAGRCGPPAWVEARSSSCYADPVQAGRQAGGHALACVATNAPQSSSLLAPTRRVVLGNGHCTQALPTPGR